MAEKILNRLYSVDDASDLRAMGALAVQGGLTLGNPNTGGYLQILRKDIAPTTVTASSLTTTWTGAYPAGSLVLGVTARVTTAITAATGVSWKLGDAGDGARWGTGLAFTAQTKVESVDWKAALSPVVYKTAGDLVAELNAGTFTTGAIAVSIFYVLMSAPPKPAA